jgi:hypothetical protein
MQRDLLGNSSNRSVLMIVSQISEIFTLAYPRRGFHGPFGASVDVTDATAGANLEPDAGLANHLLWLVNFGCSNDVKQKSAEAR